MLPSLPSTRRPEPPAPWGPSWCSGCWSSVCYFCGGPARPLSCHPSRPGIERVCHARPGTEAPSRQPLSLRIRCRLVLSPSGRSTFVFVTQSGTRFSMGARVSKPVPQCMDPALPQHLCHPILPSTTLDMVAHNARVPGAQSQALDAELIRYSAWLCSHCQRELQTDLNGLPGLVAVCPRGDASRAGNRPFSRAEARVVRQTGDR